MRFYIILFFCFILNIPLEAQQEVDQLKQALSKATVQEKASWAVKIATTYKNNRPDSFIRYAILATDYGRQYHDDISVAMGEYYQSIYLQRTGKVEEAIQLADKNLQKFKQNKQQYMLYDNFLSAKAGALMILKQEKEALDYYIESIKLGEEHENYMIQMRGNANAGWALMEMNQQKNAIVYFEKAIELIQRQHLPDQYAAIYTNLASCYGYIGQIDSVIVYAKKGIELAKQLDDIPSQCNGLFILSGAYDTKKQYQQSLDVMLKAKKLREQVADPYFSASDNASLSNAYAKVGNTVLGIATAKEALDTALKYKIDMKLPNIYLSFITNYKERDDFKNASLYYQKYIDIQDKLYDEANVKAIADLQAKYEKEKQDRKIQESNYKIAKQKLIIIGIVLFMFFSGFIVYLLYRRYQWKQQARLSNEVQRQQELAAIAVLDAEMRERNRVATDLHDGVGQMMSAVKINLSAFSTQQLSNDKEATEVMQKIIVLVDESCKEIRNVSHNMMPSALLKNSLVTAIQVFIQELNVQQPTIDFIHEGFENSFPQNVELIIYRIIQEAVNNVIKHAAAKHLQITMMNDQQGLQILIEDDGKGIDLKRHQETAGVGLKNIRARVHFLKGVIEINSAQGAGAVLSIHIPATSL